VCIMSRRVNIMVDEQLWQSLQQIPRGERSQFINVAIGERLLFLKRKSAAKKMDQIREHLSPMNIEMDVMELLRQDRMRSK